MFPGGGGSLNAGVTIAELLLWFVFGVLLQGAVHPLRCQSPAGRGRYIRFTVNHGGGGTSASLSGITCSSLCSPPEEFSLTSASYVQFLKQVHENSQHFRGVPILTCGPQASNPWDRLRSPQKSRADSGFYREGLSQGPSLECPGWLNSCCLTTLRSFRGEM